MTDAGRRVLEVPVRTARRAMAQSAIRVGTVICVAVAGYVGAGRLDDTVAVFDFRADANAAATFRGRTYPASPWVAGNWKVMEDARLWMPDDASYRVVHGPLFKAADHSGFGRYFLLGLLLPRRQTESESARWAFCYGCEASTLGPRFEVLSDSGNGFLFGRIR
jgi:hypothetical protein